MHNEIPERIELSRGGVAISRETTVEIDGTYHNVFQENTIAARVEHDSGFVCVVLFPKNYLARHKSRDDVLATALFAAGLGYAEGRSVVEVSAQ